MQLLSGVIPLWQTQQRVQKKCLQRKRFLQQRLLLRRLRQTGEKEQDLAVATEEMPAEQTTETVYTIDKVNVRSGADTSADKLGSVEKGTALTRTGTEGDWSIVDYNGTTGYIKSEFLSAAAPENVSETAASEALTEGTTIMLSNTTNIRSSMSETADKVGVAYAGEKVTVVMSYAEGWTKVTWKNKTGYIKTDLLK